MDKDFKILSEEYLLSLLNEAPGDPNTQTMPQNDPNATYEPTEQDASMGTEDDMGEGDMDPGMEEMDMGDEGGGDPSGEMSMDGGTDPSMGGAAAPTNVKDVFKKRKLFNDYKELLEVIDNVMESSNKILLKNLPDDAQKIYTFIRDKMEENKQKIIIIMTEQYLLLSYQQLLTLYMYLKIATKSYTDIVKQISCMYEQGKRNFSQIKK